MIKHPPSHLRTRVLVSSAVGALFGLLVGSAFGWHVLNSAFENGFLKTAGLLCFDVLLFAMGATSAVIWRAVRKGPDAGPPLVVESEDRHLSMACGAVTTVFAGFALTWSGELLANEEQEARAFLWIMVGGFVLFGALFLLATVAQVRKQMRGRSRLVLAENPIQVGQRLRGRVEVPFPQKDRVALRLTLELVQVEQGVSDDDVPEHTVLWNNVRTSLAETSAGFHRAAAELHMGLPDEPPTDGARCHHFWSLTVEPVDETIAWQTLFTVPLCFQSVETSKLEMA